VSGDLLLAAIIGGGNTPPAGWSLISGDASVGLYSRTAGGSEPATYTWTLSSGGQSRSGCMIALRNGVLGDFSSNFAQALQPSATAGATAGGIYVGFYVQAFGVATGDSISATSPGLVMQTQHDALGSAPYSYRVNTGISARTGLGSSEVCNAEDMVHPDGDDASTRFSAIYDNT